MALPIRKLERGARAARWLPRGVVLWVVVIGLAWTTLTFAQESEPMAPAAVNAVDTGSIPTRNLLDAVRDGGPLMMAIAICSFVLCVFVFERAASLRRGRVIPRPFVKRLSLFIRQDLS